MLILRRSPSHLRFLKNRLAQSLLESISSETEVSSVTWNNPGRRRAPVFLPRYYPGRHRRSGIALIFESADFSGKILTRNGSEIGEYI